MNLPKKSTGIEVQIVNAFIDGERGGNPAGVVVNANGLTTAQKLAAAKAVGLSETAFVSASQIATFKLEFFTPTRQIAHCGHATIATFSLLQQLGMVSQGLHSKETIDGKRDIVVQNDMAFMEQRAPTYQPIAQGSELMQRILSSLGVDSQQLLPQLTPCVVNTGNSFLLIPLASENAVQALKPIASDINAISEELDLIGYYVFSRTTKESGRMAGTRMFAPRFGIAEEAGTGMAAGPLACYLHDVMHLKDTTFLIEQGWLMPTPSPSVIHVELTVQNGRVTRLMAGGRAKVNSVQTIGV